MNVLFSITVAIILLLMSCGQMEEHMPAKLTDNFIEEDSFVFANPDEQKPRTFDSTKKLKIYLNNAGKIFVDGQEASISELEAKMRLLLNLKGGIYYAGGCKPCNVDVVCIQCLKAQGKLLTLRNKYKLPRRHFVDSLFTKSGVQSEPCYFPGESQ